MSLADTWDEDWRGCSRSTNSRCTDVSRGHADSDGAGLLGGHWDTRQAHALARYPILLLLLNSASTLGFAGVGSLTSHKLTGAPLAFLAALS